jgi:PAS domain-containing protein
MIPDALATSWNRGAEQMLGYTAAEVVGQSSGQFVPLESRAAMHEHRFAVKAKSREHRCSWSPQSAARRISHRASPDWISKRFCPNRSIKRSCASAYPRRWPAERGHLEIRIGTNCAAHI